MPTEASPHIFKGFVGCMLGLSWAPELHFLIDNTWLKRGVNIWPVGQGAGRQSLEHSKTLL